MNSGDINIVASKRIPSYNHRVFHTQNYREDGMFHPPLDAD